MGSPDGHQQRWRCEGVHTADHEADTQVDLRKEDMQVGGCHNIQEQC